MKKKARLGALALALTLALTACGGGGGSKTPAPDKEKPAATETKIIRVSNGINDKHPAYEASLKFKELVEEATDELEVEVYHSGQIADDRSAIEMLQFGTLDSVITSTSPLANFIPEYAVFDLPFTVQTPEQADKLLDGPFGETMFDLLADQELVGIAWWENGFRNVTNSVRAIETVDDLKGMKLRTMESEIHLDAWKALGANPTPMAFTELFSAMQQGTVDGQENPYPTIDLSQFAEVQEHLSNTNHVYTPFLFLFSKSIWDEMTEEQQKIVKDSAREAGLYNRELNRKVANESLESLKEKMTYTEISPENIKAFQDAVAPVIEKHADAIGKDIVDAYLEGLKE